jgi:hypothetical protein
LIKKYTKKIIIFAFVIIVSNCASSQNINEITVDLSTISEPVPVRAIVLGVGRSYFSSEQAAIEGFSDFFSNNMGTILKQFTEMTGVTIDISSFLNNTENHSNIFVDDGGRARAIRWQPNIPTDEIWARITVIFAERDVSVNIYILKPGMDLVYGVNTPPSAHIWLGAETKVPER